MLEHIQTNDSKPRVTVAILAYYEHFLDECISSVLSQTYRNIKIIVCDDCSPHDLRSVVDRFDDPRLIYRRNDENLGEGGNGSKAIDLCDTEFISLFHGDDVMLPWMIEEQVAVFDAEPSAGAVFTTCYCYDRDVSRKRAHGKLYKQDQLVLEMARRSSNLVISPSIMYRRASFEPFRPLLRESVLDMHSWMILNHAGLEMFGLDTPLMVYRPHEANTSNRMRAHEWLNIAKHMYKWSIGQGYSEDVLSFMRGYLVKMVLSPIIRHPKECGIDGVMEQRGFIEQQLGYPISDADFAEGVAVGYLGPLVIDPSRDPRELRARVAKMRTLGLSVPWKRRLKWLIRYHVLV